MSGELIAEIVLVAICLAMGGVLKGATGAGAPILAIPALVLLFDVRFAIVIMLVPNTLTNIWQVWKFREHMPSRAFLAPLLVGGAAGILIGTFLLASLPTTVLSLFVACSVLGYIVLRLAKPDWKIKADLAQRLALPAGIAAGFLQGASGLSAPVSITFLNAMRMPRPVFIITISMFFACFSVVQFVALAQADLFTLRELALSAFAVLPVTLAMPLGARLAKTLKPEIFDRLILGLLALIALRLFANIWL